MPTITLPAGKPGQPYYECYTLTGKPKRLAMDSFPVGVTATLKGKQLCIKADKFPESGFDWGVHVLSCRLCDPLELSGTIAATAEDCPCEVVGEITPPAPISVTQGDDISLIIDLIGTGPFEFCDEYRVPKCLSVEIYGDKVLIAGKAEASGVIAFSVKNPCTCDCQEVLIPVTVTPAPCLVSWSIGETSFVVGQTKTQTYSATGIPAGCSITLAAYTGNVPLVIGGVLQTLTLTASAPTASFPQTWPASYVGTDLNWRPAPVQSPCMTCTIQPARIDFDVTAVPACTTSWSLSTTSFAVGQTANQTYTATGIPAGCSLVLEAFNGNSPLIIGGSQATATLTAASPSVTFPQTWTAAFVGADLNWRPAAVQPSCMTCTVQPLRIDFDVTPLPTCTTSWSISETAFVSGTSKPQTYTATGIPAGCSLNLLAWRADNTPLLIGGIQATVTLTSAAPTLTFPQLYPADNSLVGSYYWAPAAAQASCMTCVIQPARQNFTVAASAGVGCYTHSCTTTAGGEVSHTVTINGGPVGVQYRGESSTDGGATWSSDFPPSLPITAPSMVLFTRVGTSCPAVIVAPDGTFRFSTDAPTFTRRIIVGGVQLPVCASPAPCTTPITTTSTPACGSTTNHTIAAGQSIPFGVPSFVNASGLTVSGHPAWVTVTNNGGAPGSVTISGSNATVGTSTIVFTAAGANGCPPCTVTHTLTVTSAVPPPPSCPSVADGFSPLPPGWFCGGVESQTIVAGGNNSFSQSFDDTTSTSVSGAPVGAFVTAGTSTAVVSMSSWPAGNYNLVFTGSAPGCPNCSRTIQLTVTPAPQCATNWSLSTTAFQVGVTANQTYTATGIPAGCSLTLEAWENGSPMNIGGIFPTVTLTAASPSVTFPQTWPASYVGQNLQWRPAAAQSSCMTCTINPQFISYTVSP